MVVRRGGNDSVRCWALGVHATGVPQVAFENGRIWDALQNGDIQASADPREYLESRERSLVCRQFYEPDAPNKSATPSGIQVIYSLGPARICEGGSTRIAMVEMSAKRQQNSFGMRKQRREHRRDTQCRETKERKLRLCATIREGRRTYPWADMTTRWG